MPTLPELQELHGKTEFDTMQTAFQKGFFVVDRDFFLSPEAAAAGRMISYCRTPVLGGIKVLCSCGKEKTIYKPSHNRSCPCCNGQENQEWLEFHKERMIDKEYLHMVFVAPEVLNDLYLKNKKEMTSLLIEAIKKMFKKKYKGKMGAITLSVHSSASVLTVHLHVHCLILLGTYDEENNKFEKIGAGRYNVSEMEKEFEEEYRKEFKKAEKKKRKDGKIGFKEGSEKIDIDKVTDFKIWKEGKYKGSAEAVLKYFSNSVRGGPISNDRILKVTDETVTFAYKNKQTKEEYEAMTLGLTEFIRRVLLHVPAKGQKLVRNLGLYSGSKKEGLEKCLELLEKRKVVLKTKKEKKKAKKERGETMKYFCPKCGKEMKVVEEILPLFKLLKKAV